MSVTVTLFLSSFLLFIVLSSAVPILRQVQVVTRHGARTPLTKSATTLQEASATLTHIGEKQLYDLGTWLREKYAGLGVVDTYNSTLVRIESSDYDRTIVSAQMLAQGLFLDRPSNPLLPKPANNTNIPVYTNSKLNDVTIRAYDKCPTFLDNLKTLYASETFLALEKEHEQLLNALAAIPAFSTYAVQNTIPLSNVWNIFDLINVAKIECATNYETSDSCQSLPDPALATVLNDAQWTELQSMANHAELLKYSTAGGKLLGSNLLRTIQSRMNITATMPSFVLYSAHYPTILGLMSSILGENDILKEAIPNYATALIFELYTDSDTNQQSVAIHYKEGLQNETTTMELTSMCPGKLSCPLESFGALLSSGNAGATSQEYWCDECNNGSADVCLRTQLTKLTTARNEVSSCEREPINNGIIAVTFFGGVGMGLVLVAVWLCVRKPTSGHSAGQKEPEAAETLDCGTTC
jgi:Histidine phosphatase superfamily (branch 2)